MLAEHSGRLVNYSRLGSKIVVSHKTAQRYVGLLEQLFLVATLQPWFTNALKRIVKIPKLHFLDPGLLASERGLTFEKVKADRRTFGSLLESFVFSERGKTDDGLGSPANSVSFPGPRCARGRHGARTRRRNDRGHRSQGGRHGLSPDFAGLRALAEACGDRFAFGVVLYDSADVVPFGKRLAAAPLSCLWN